MKLKILSILLLFCIGLHPNADACVHRPRGVNRAFEQSAQQAIIVHHNGYEDLIIKVKYKFSGPGQNPNNLAWLIPTPNTPVSYKVARHELFQEAMIHFPNTNQKNDLLRFGRSGIARKPRRGQRKKKSVKLLDLVLVGNYQIQPIVATGPQAGTELNQWLSQNGYGEVPIKNMAWYLKNKWTFLAIKMTHDAGKGPLPSKGEFNPLHLRFKSEKIVYPLKFSSHQGVYNVSLYVITSKWLNRYSSWGQREWDPERFKRIEESYYRQNILQGYWAFWQAAKYGFEIAGTCQPIRYKGFWKDRRRERRGRRLTMRYQPHLYRLLTVIDARDPLPEFLYLNKFVGRNVNDAHNRVEDWANDFSIEYLDEEKQLKKMRPPEERIQYFLKQMTLSKENISEHHLVSLQVYSQLMARQEWQKKLIFELLKLRADQTRRSSSMPLFVHAHDSSQWILDTLDQAQENRLSLSLVGMNLVKALDEVTQSKDKLRGPSHFASLLLDSRRSDLRCFAMAQLNRYFHKWPELRKDPKAMECVIKAALDPNSEVRRLAHGYKP